MGNFYVNMTLKAERIALKSLLDHISDRSVIGPDKDGWLTFSSVLLEQQDQQNIDDYGIGLSEQFAGPVIAVLNHDDDVLSIDLYEGGARTATYNSCPGYFREDATAADFEPKFTNPEAYDALAPGKGVGALLSSRPIFAIEAHVDFNKLVGLPGESAGFGFRNAERGEFEGLTLSWTGRCERTDS